jgi:hypothetical protein
MPKPAAVAAEFVEPCTIVIVPVAHAGGGPMADGRGPASQPSRLARRSRGTAQQQHSRAGRGARPCACAPAACSLAAAAGAVGAAFTLAAVGAPGGRRIAAQRSRQWVRPAGVGRTAGQRRTSRRPGCQTLRSTRRTTPAPGPGSRGAWALRARNCIGPHLAQRHAWPPAIAGAGGGGWEVRGQANVARPAGGCGRGSTSTVAVADNEPPLCVLPLQSANHRLGTL